MDMYAIRRQRLRFLIANDPLAQGNQAAFAERLGYTRAQISQYLSATYNNGRSPGEQAARALETKAKLPPLWLDGCDNLTQNWPFPDIPRDAFEALPDAAKAQAGRFISSLIQEHGQARAGVRRSLAMREDEMASLLSTDDALGLHAATAAPRDERPGTKPKGRRGNKADS
ncbi:hypothetical protein ANDA3_3096 [plant metagenome]|uniref:Uncharacterized protein n=1 Tax=plant metagenome TaxID=1297885 RepID=A0A484U0F8_9ZZZZ